MLLFFSGRISFLGFNNPDITFSEYFPAFYKGFLLDISAACYLSLFPVFVFVWNEFKPTLLNEKILLFYFVIAVALVISVEVASIFLYQEWGNTLNYRAIRYLLYPTEAVGTIDLKTIISGLLLTVLFSFGWIFIFRKTLSLGKNSTEQKQTIAFALMVLTLLFMGIRGSFGKIALSESNAYFSENNFLNQTALNKAWYFSRNVLNNVNQKKPFYNFPEYSNPNLRDKLYISSDTQQWLKHKKPNIILITLEGWSADIISSLGGEKNITPGFDSLVQSGLFFTNIYSSGTRTDQGVMSILSGFPALPDLSIVQEIEKSVKLPSLIRDLKNAGYQTSFIYGGELDYCNFKTYFAAQGTDKLIDKYDYPVNQRTIAWGVPDHFMFEKASVELQNVSEPFFAYMLTLSSHHPFDSPHTKSEKTTDNAGKYKAIATYMDKAMAEFMSRSKSEKWYDNTLFIFLSDHGSKLPLERDYNDHERFHIPMLFYGNVLDSSFIGKKINTVANHHDLPATLLSQLNLASDAYCFSKNILADTLIPFAYWSTDNTMGWITKSQKIGINLHNAEVFSATTQPVNEEQKIGVGYVQEILKEYEKY